MASSSFLRGSANYVWITTSVLGKGATGAVYQGVDKNTGEAVAVKTFNNVSKTRHPEIQLREFEVIQKVNHENIVKLLAIEEEQDGSKVIVMELCTGGSLYTILDDPENTYGLQEEEFLLVLEHLTAGMKHLRDNNLVHRDLKPGNIMKFISDDGCIIFKLTDFGAARELQEGQQFVSLYGTEEYLHPDLYERAVLKQTVGKAFGASVDLWSIGVTLYHVATGNLPFRPFGGRRNKKTMYYITTQKASGVISGTQLKEEGPIEWSRELPNTCQLSGGLQRLIIPLMGGLMEANTQKVWSFDRFFSEVTDILQRKILHIFFVNKAQNIRVYLHPNLTYGELQSLIRDQTDVKPDSQYLLFKDQTLLGLVDENTLGRGYPTTQEAKPIFLYIKDNNNISAPSENTLPKFPTFAESKSVEGDANVAKIACSVGHEYKRRIERYARISCLNHASVEMLTSVIVKELEQTLHVCHKLQDLSRYAKEIVAVVMRSQTIAQKLSSSCRRENSELSDWKEPLSTLTAELTNELAPTIQQLYQRYATDRTLQREWSTATREIKCPSEKRVPNIACTLVGRLRESWQVLLRDRNTRNLTYNDEQFHVLEKIKVTDFGKKFRELVERETTPPLMQQADCMADWYNMAQTVLLKSEILKKDVEKFEARLDDLVLRISDDNRSFHDELLMKLLTLKDKSEAQRQQRSSSRNLTLSQEDEQVLRDILKFHKEIANVVEMNGKLANELQALSLN